MKVLGLILLFGLGAEAHGQMAGMPMDEHHEHKAKMASTALLVTAGGQSTTFKLADLQAMPQRSLTVHNAHSNKDETYTGVGLNDLLAKFKVSMDNGGAKQVYHSYVRAEGTDHYYVVYSATELESAAHAGDAMVALTVDGKALTEDGQFKMVVGGDKKPARWVTNLAKLTVVTVE